MEKYEAIAALIAENTDIVDFADFGNAVSDFWINKAQDHLKVAFPPSYIWWLRNYGGGEIFGDEIYSVYQKDFGTFIGGDIVYINELDRKNGLVDNKRLVIQRNDQGETYYFDLLQADEYGECPVYRYINGSGIKYANDFLDFLAKRIEDGY